jgi:two-component system sensor histidine kinase/response regulator
MFKKYFRYLVGEPGKFSLESRMYHAISIVISLTLFVKALFYQFTSLEFASIACGLFGLSELILYYLSRFKQQLKVAVTLSVLKLSLMHILTYLFNAGISGNMLLLSAITLFLIILIIPEKQGLLWLAINLSIVFTMLTLEYFNEDILQQIYQSRTEQFIDLGVTYLTIGLILYTGLIILRKNYAEQKMLAEEKTAKLVQLNQEKDKLFSVISHDLSSPMTSVKIYLDLLDAVDLEKEERSSMTKDLTQSLGDAQNLLQNLLLWAKSQMQNSQMQLEEVHLRSLFNEAVELVEQRASKKNIQIHIAMEPKLKVVADPDMLELVIRNLMNNAVKFTKTGGEISVSAVVADGHCIIAVKDNGIGIAKAKQAKIFSLQIVSSYGTNNEKGTGLGLMLCKDYTERQGGKIWFESEPQQGSTFYVSLPVVVS